ncbi:MAG: PfkB family carbohydrate kinase [Thermodesulfovibrionales bacterium]|nr:PfkB family carbohydrate kinase [Thermodesulfovibrionales bacterium]
MERAIKNKILVLDGMVRKAAALRREGKVVVQSHGIFDIVHPGIIRHLTEAKKLGNVLIVTVIKDKDVRRGPGRPIFPEQMRVENAASLWMVDYVCMVDDETPFDCVKMIKPDVFAKGQTYHERDQKIHKKIFEAEKELYFGQTKIQETEGFSFSSSSIINNFLDIYPDDTKAFLRKFSKKYDFKDIADTLNNIKDMKVLLIGDGIIDEYHYCDSMGKSAKAPLVVSRYLAHEVFTGGAFAIANHVAGLCGKVHLVSLLGNHDSREDFIRKNLKPNIDAKFFYRDDGPTVIKKRYINQYLNQKLFEINYLSDSYIGGQMESDISAYIRSVMPGYDLVMVSDFGHGFITGGMIRAIEGHAGKLAVNTQTNSANAGYNMITKYRRSNFICLDEPEIRLAAQERFANIEDVAKNMFNVLNTDCLVVTLGKKGAIAVSGNEDAVRTPIFSSKVVDTVGAGDAVFAFTAPIFASGAPLEMISFIGNAAGALAVQIVCNKKPIEKHELLEFIHALLR